MNNVLRRVAVIVAFCVSALVSDAPAQADKQHFVGMRDFLARLRDDAGNRVDVAVPHNFGTATAELHWVRQGVTSVVQLPMHRVTGVRVIRNRALLVAGREYTQWSPLTPRGVLHVMSWASGSPVVLDTQVYANHQFDRLVFSDDVIEPIFFIDFRERALGLIPFGGDAATALPTSLPVLTDDQHFPALRWPYQLMVGPSAEPDLMVRVHSRDTMLAWWDLTNPTTPGHWTAGLSVEDDPPSQYSVSPASHFDADGSVYIAVPPGGATSYSFWDEDLVQQVGSGVLSAGAVNTVTLPAPIDADLHHMFSLRVPGAEDTRFYPIIEHGVHCQHASLTIGHVLAHPELSCVNSPRYGISAGIDARAAAGPIGVTYNVAFRDSQGDDPVTFNAAGYAVLDPAASASVTVDPAEIDSLVGMTLAIPDDAGLAGTVVLWQVVFALPNGGLAYTNVVGTGIRGGASEALRSLPSSGDGREAWLRAAGLGEPNEDLLRRMQRQRE